MRFSEADKQSARQAWRNRLPERLQFLELCSAWIERSRDRERLTALDERILRDMGISRYDVGLETRKWFWQA